jgi:DNA modification methylase
VAEVVVGDCIEKMAGMEARSFDLCFADPPFNIDYKYDLYVDSKPFREYMDWSGHWVEGVKRLLRPGGTFWLAIGDAFASDLDVLCRRQLGFHRRSWVIWHYTFGVNCLRRSTKFITNAGVKSFEDFSDGDETIVLTPRGNWKRAKVRCYGLGTVYPVVFRRKGGVDQTVWATENHRWLLNDNSFVTTRDLPERAVLMAAPAQPQFDYDSAAPDERLWWCYGFVFGDGSVNHYPDSERKYSSVRLCGSKNCFKSRFEEMGFKTTSPKSIRGDTICYTGSYLKEAPDPSLEPQELLRAFVRGYLDADGAHECSDNSIQPFRSICTSDEVHANFIRDAFPANGFYLTTETSFQSKGYANSRPGTRFSVATQVIRNAPYRHARTGWDEGVREEVWCLEVEGDESFMLPNGISTGNSKKKFTPSHTHLFQYVKDPASFTFNAGAIKVPSARQLVYGDKRAKSGGRLPDDVWVLRPQDAPDGLFDPAGDTWYIPRLCGTHKERVAHPCQMPLAVLDRIIKVSSNPGDLVLDPFAGSFTTLVAAKKLGRRCVGIELSEAYAEMGRKRVEATESLGREAVGI